MADETTATKATEALELPKYLQTRPTYNGYVVPFFVSWFRGDQQVNENEVDAKPSFPTIDMGRLNSCRKHNRCWICGIKLGTYKTFVFGPASAINRMSYEPPSHRDCARYAAQVCPYIINPKHTHVTERAIPYRFKEGESKLDDVSPHHPGLVVLYTVKYYTFKMQDRARGIGLFELPEANNCEFYCEGRPATIAEVVTGIRKAIDANGMIDPSQPDKMRELAWRTMKLTELANGP